MPTPLVNTADLDAFEADGKAQKLEAALAAVRSFCGWHIAPVLTETVTVDAVDLRSTFLPTLELVEVVSVTQAGVEVDLSTLTSNLGGTVASRTGYRLGTMRCEPLIVVFRHGHEALPADVKQVVLSMALRASVNPTGLVSTQVTGAVVDEFGPAGMSDAERALLAPHCLTPAFA